MKKGIIYSLFLGFLALAGCSPKVTVNYIKAKAPLEPEEEVATLQPSESVPDGAVVLEAMRLTGADYQELVGMATEKARDAGGDILKIINHLEPDIASPRHRVSALVFAADSSFLQGTQAPSVSADELASWMNLRRESCGWHFAAQGGAVYRLGRVANNLSNVEAQHIKNMRWGFSYGADVSYFVHENFGVGIKFHNFHSADSMPISAVDQSGKVLEGVEEDKMDIYFIGPIATFRLPSRNRANAFFARMGIGFEGYYDYGRVMDVKGTIKGRTAGILYEAGYDFGISKHLSVGANITYLIGFLTGIDVNTNQQSGHIDLDKDNMENISHIGLNIGLRYNL
ncbi:MAG: porin family protein [Bacteroidota bacterium]|nr:porin family protein [Bacteroidota bacterium]